MSRTKLSLFFFCLISSLFLGTNRAQARKDITVSADSSSGSTESELLLDGNVQIIFKDQHIQCRRARVNFRAKTIDAVGDIYWVSPQTSINGERVLLDYETGSGIIFGGFVQSGQAVLTGDSISKIGESEYLAEEASFTACTNCPETWLFKGQRIRAQMGGYAFIKNSWFKVGGVPVFWLPYLVLPLKSGRQSGLLNPEIESSVSGGLAISDSLFWVINPSQDATLTFKNYELRGFKTLANYRYVLSPTSNGELSVSSVRDRFFANQDRVNKFRTADEEGKIVNRWFANYRHFLDLPEGFVHRLQIINSSDLQYAKDFPKETNINGDSAMESRMSLTKNTRSNHFSIDSSYYVNMLRSDPLVNNNDAVHRIPEIRLAQTISKISDTNFLYSYDINSTQFVRTDFGYDDLNAPPNSGGSRRIATGTNPACQRDDWYRVPGCSPQRDGKFDPGTDLIRTGQRLNVIGTLYRPIKVGDYIDFLPQLSYRETYYQFNLDQDASNSRRLLQTQLTTRTNFSKIYGDLNNFKGNRWKHELIPEIDFRTIPWINQPAHPFFGSQSETPFFDRESLVDSDLNSPYGIQFDYTDRVYDRKLMTFSIINKLTQKIWGESKPEYAQIIYWKLSQSYDFYQAESVKANAKPYSDLQSDFRSTLGPFVLYQRTTYYPYQLVSNTDSSLRYNFKNGDMASVRHVSTNTSEPRSEEYTLVLGTAVGAFDVFGKLTLNAVPTTEKGRVKSYGYYGRLRLPGNCWFLNFSQYKTTGGDDNTWINFGFIWDGKPLQRLEEKVLEDLRI